jgi:coenzyme F420-reducing hydrogenase alpha subunit
MHQVNLDLSLQEISKIEGNAGLDLSISNNVVTKCEFKITEYKRFYTQAIKGKAALAAPALLARICGTCSNAHILAACKAVESALKITPSSQTEILRRLLMNGLYIRDHALHLYLFVLPDLFNKNSLLDFAENNPQEHQWLDDAFSVKDAGNQLSILVGGRSVHAPYPQVGGFNQTPKPEAAPPVILKLQTIRPAVSRLIKVFTDCPWDQKQDVPYLTLKDGQTDYRKFLSLRHLSYSQASAYVYKDRPYLTGALARLNLAKNPPPPFPSHNLYHNNLAQAVEILNAIDDSVKILQSAEFTPESSIKSTLSSGEGIGLIEAPRGILYHRLTIKDMVVTDAEILVPTGQNQLNIANDIKNLVNAKLKSGQFDKTTLEHDIEVLIRAYDPCMSCASHFLKIKWA